MLWLLTGCGADSLSKCRTSEEPSICIMESIQASKSTVDELIVQCQTASFTEKLLGECMFLISDEQQLIGEQARQLCRQATPFVEDCLRHAAARDVEQNIFAQVQQATPTPMKLLPRIHGVVRQYLDPQIAESMSRDMVLRFQAVRVSDSLQQSDCEGFPLSMCAQVYILASLGTREQWSANYEEDWMTHCGQILTQQQALQWGWKQWSVDMNAAVQQAYQQICQAVPAAKSDSSK